ncbi:MAG: hypothetical protein AAGG11_14510 [Pseudomonadota bacterium]
MELKDLKLGRELDTTEMRQATGGWQLRNAWPKRFSGAAQGIPGNAAWAEGDWNGDGAFSSDDLILMIGRGSD